VAWIGNQVRLERRQGSLSRVFYILSLNLSLKYETVNEL